MLESPMSSFGRALADLRPEWAACARPPAAASWSPVKLKRASDNPDGSPATLGDLLYADGSAASPEDEWVQLVQAIATGDQEAMRLLYQRTHRLVFTLAMRISNCREIAEEITLDVFHEVWRRAGLYDPAGGSVVGWIMNQARSRAIDRLRFDQRKKRVPPHRDQQEEPAVEASGPADVADARRRGALLHQALDKLTADERRVIETAFFSDLTYAETAACLDQPLGTVKTRIRSALAKLREALEGAGS